MFNFDFSVQFSNLKKIENIILIVCIIILNFADITLFNFFKKNIGFSELKSDNLISEQLVFGILLAIFFGIIDFILGKLFPFFRE